MPPEDDPQHNRHEARLTRLEEAIGFTDHAQEQLAAEVRLLSNRLHEFGRRISEIESRLGLVFDRIERVESQAPSMPPGETRSE